MQLLVGMSKTVVTSGLGINTVYSFSCRLCGTLVSCTATTAAGAAGARGPMRAGLAISAWGSSVLEVPFGCFHKFGVSVLGVLRIRASLFGVYNSALDF